MQQLSTVNPATNSPIKAYEMMASEDAFKKVEASHAAFLRWRKLSHEQRASYLRKIADALRENSDRLARLMTEETGKLLRDSKTEVELCAQIFEYTAEHGPSILADEERSLGNEEKRGIVAYCPLGVIYSVQPWNFPVYQPARVLASNLMAGNAVVLKHASICTGSGLLFRDICIEAGLPDGLFDVVIVDHDVSDAIIGHDRIRAVTMTGSDDAGGHIGQVAAKHLKKTVLELGSNDAYLVLDDANIELAVKTCVQGRLYNNGETCVSAKRFIVTETNYDAFTKAFVAQMQAVKMGDPMNDETDLGPVASREQFETLCNQVQESIDCGAELLCGGDPSPSEGHYYPPTVLAGCKPGMPAYDDELFGPVASIIKARDNADAMRLANDSRFGLGGGIFSESADDAVVLARDEFDTGMIRINSFGAADPHMPFGGVKDSGYGREHGGFGMKEFVNIKAIFLP